MPEKTTAPVVYGAFVRDHDDDTLLGLAWSMTGAQEIAEKQAASTTAHRDGQAPLHWREAREPETLYGEVPDGAEHYTVRPLAVRP